MQEENAHEEVSLKLEPVRYVNKYNCPPGRWLARYLGLAHERGRASRLLRDVE